MLVAVDTNVVIRLITGDDEDQVRRVLDMARTETLFVSSTVLVEAEWVLRSRYGYDRAAICDALLGLSDLVAIRFEHDADVRWAIDRFAASGELADYLHIAAARPIGRFASFERRLPMRAGADAPADVFVPA